MNWFQVTQVLSIKPVTDERHQREWIKRKKTKSKKKPQPKDIQKDASHKIDIYI
ncbi:MAG: hypothetical protein GXO22_01515 [Aquificae bacterium]|nr:hypothetical protein [Aquificota bacterium]